MRAKLRLTPKSFPPEKLLLLAALACELLALLIRKGVFTADPELVARLTVAGAVLVLIYLVYDGIKRKARKIRAQLGLDEEADEPSGEETDGESKENDPPAREADGSQNMKD